MDCGADSHLPGCALAAPTTQEFNYFAAILCQDQGNEYWTPGCRPTKQTDSRKLP